MLPALNPRPDTPPPETSEPLPCHCCGFKAETERKQARIDGRARPVCSICDAALHLRHASWSHYTLAWMPELDQAAVSHLARTALVADAIANVQPPKDKAEFDKEVDGYLKRCGTGETLPREVFDAVVRGGADLVSSSLNDRVRHLREMLEMKGDAEIVGFLANLPVPTRDKLLVGLRVVPRGVYESTVRTWIEGGSPYAEIDGERLHRMKGYVDA